jgi:1-acyl-sn-glycerol-3-phosphate acyltransferase
MSTWARRAVTFPVYAITFLLLFSLAPPLLLLALIADLLRRSRLSLCRSYLMVLFYFGCELVGLIGAFALWLRGGSRFLDGNFRLQWWWAGTLFAAARRLFGLRVEVEGGELSRPGPVLILIRHASVADTLLPVALVSRPHRLRLRYVLKRELLWDPCLDVVGQRLPNAFVRRSPGPPAGGDSSHDIAAVQALMDGLGPDDGVLLFPEGTRATPQKRQRVLQSIHDARLLERAKRLKHLLPPRLGGVLALLERNHNADVVFLGHSGFEKIRTLADLFRGRLVGAEIRVKLWRCPRRLIPDEGEARISWLFDEWQKLDDWCEGPLSEYDVGGYAHSRRR